jgi:hypothetical protein
MDHVGRGLQQRYGSAPIPRIEIVEEVAKECGCARESVIPSDHCYDRTHEGIRLENEPMFVHVGQPRSGLYRFLGRNYPYTGPLFHYPKGGSPQQVGEWVSGQLRYFGNRPVVAEISVERLKGLSYVAQDDLYDLARLLLRLHQADEERTGCRGRTTVGGIATAFANLRSCDREPIRRFLKNHGLPLSATIEAVASSSETARNAAMATEIGTKSRASVGRKQAT